MCTTQHNTIQPLIQAELTGLKLMLNTSEVKITLNAGQSFCNVITGVPNELASKRIPILRDG